MKVFKFFALLAFLTSTGSVAGNWFLYQRYQAERAASQELESQQVELQEQNQSLLEQVSKSKQYEQELGRLRDQLKDYVNQRESLKKEMDGALADAANLRKQIQVLESEKKALEEQLNVGQVTDNAIAREAEKIAVLPAAPPPAPLEEVPPLKPAKQARESKEKDKREKGKKEAPKESPKEAPGKETGTPFAPLPPAGGAVDQRPLQILSVNRQFKFVVINGGIRGNLKVGDTLRVEQNGKLAGRIQVEKLYENFSACNIVEENQPAQIREGDLVRVA